MALLLMGFIWLGGHGVLIAQEVGEPIITTANESKPVPKNTQTKEELQQSYEEYYKRMFGKSAPKEVVLEIVLSVTVDFQKVGDVTVQSNSFSTWFKFPKSSFFRIFKYFLKPSIMERYKLEFRDSNWISQEWFIENGFKIEFLGSEKKLVIETPQSARGIMELDLSKSEFEEDKPSYIKPAYVSSFTNIDINNNLVNYYDLNRLDKNYEMLFSTQVNVGSTFINQNLNYLSSPVRAGWTFSDLWASRILSKKKRMTRIGFLPDFPVAGFQINNMFYRKLTNSKPQTRTYSFDLNAPGTLTVYVNGASQHRKDLYPGKYRIRNIRANNGPNNIEIMVMEAGKGVVYEKKFFEFRNNEKLLSVRDQEYDLNVGYYDSEIGSFLERPHNLFVSHTQYRLGVGSIPGLSNMTLDTQWYYNRLENWTEFTLYSGTRYGILSPTLAFSKLPSSDLGYEFSFSYAPDTGDENMGRDQSNDEQKSYWNSKISLNNKTYINYFMDPSKIAEPTRKSGSIRLALNGFSNKNFPLDVKTDHVINFDGSFQSTYKLGTRMNPKDWSQLNTGIQIQFSDTAPPQIGWSWSYQYNLKNYPIQGAANYSVDANQLDIATNITIAELGGTPIQTSFAGANQNFKLTKETETVKHDFSYNISQSGDSLSWQSNSENDRGKLSYSIHKPFSADPENNFISSTLVLNTSVMTVGKKFAIGNHVESGSFAVVSAHPAFEGTKLLANDSKIDAVGAAGLGYISPFQKNTINFEPERVPIGIEIKRSAIEFIPEYGKGYSFHIGEEAPLMLMGRLVDQIGKPYALEYGMIHFNDKTINFFTNKRGRFQLAIPELGHDYVLELVEYPGRSHEFKLPKTLKGFHTLPKVIINRKIILKEGEVLDLPNKVSMELLNGYGEDCACESLEMAFEFNPNIQIHRMGNAATSDYEETKLVVWDKMTPAIEEFLVFYQIPSPNVLIKENPDKNVDLTLVLGNDWHTLFNKPPNLTEQNITMYADIKEDLAPIVSFIDTFDTSAIIQSKTYNNIETYYIKINRPTNVVHYHELTKLLREKSIRYCELPLPQLQLDSTPDQLFSTSNDMAIQLLNGIDDDCACHSVEDILNAQSSSTNYSIASIGDAGNFNYTQSKLVLWKGYNYAVNHFVESFKIPTSNIITRNVPNKPFDATLVLGQDWNTIFEGIGDPENPVITLYSPKKSLLSSFFPKLQRFGNINLKSHIYTTDIIYYIEIPFPINGIDQKILFELIHDHNISYCISPRDANLVRQKPVITPDIFMGPPTQETLANTPNYFEVLPQPTESTSSPPLIDPEFMDETMMQQALLEAGLLSPSDVKSMSQTYDIQLLNGSPDPCACDYIEEALDPSANVSVVSIGNAANYDYKASKLIIWDEFNSDIENLLNYYTLSTPNFIKRPTEGKPMHATLVVGKDWKSYFKSPVIASQNYIKVYSNDYQKLFPILKTAQSYYKQAFIEETPYKTGTRYYINLPYPSDPNVFQTLIQTFYARNIQYCILPQVNTKVAPPSVPVISKPPVSIELLNGNGDPCACEYVEQVFPESDNVSIHSIGKAANYEYKSSKFMIWHPNSEGVSSFLDGVPLKDRQIITNTNLDKPMDALFVLGQDWTRLFPTVVPNYPTTFKVYSSTYNGLTTLMQTFSDPSYQQSISTIMRGDTLLFSVDIAYPASPDALGELLHYLYKHKLEYCIF